MKQESRLTVILVVAAVAMFLGLISVGIVRLERPIEVTVVKEDQSVEESAEVEEKPVEEEIVEEEEPNPPPRVPPPPPEPELPCEGLISPGAPVYGLSGDKIVPLGNLKIQYFHCKVHKKISTEKRVYYLVEINHEGFRQDFYLIETKHVTLLACAGDLALLPE